MDIQKLIKQYIQTAQVMQLATVVNNKPWACTVHFDYDDEMNLFWISDQDCRHSKEVAQNPNAAVAIAVKTDWPVVGLQFEGEAKLVEDMTLVERAVKSFAKRHNRDDKFVDSVVAGSKSVYMLKPTHIQMFDPKDFPQAPVQEWHL